MNFQRKLIAGLAAAGAALLVVAVLTYLSTMANVEDRMWVNHTHVVLETLAAVEIESLNAETLQRGFLLTGGQTYLSGYQSAQARVDERVKELQELTADNPRQQVALIYLEDLLRTKAANLGSHVRRRQEEGLQSGIATVQEGSADRLSEQVSASIRDMREEEQRLLTIRTEELLASSRRTSVVIIAGDTLGFVFLFLAGIVIYKEMSRRAAAETAVRTLNAELEAKVASRTAELAERARELERSNIELQQFAYVASHDLQEPLRTISSFTQLLAKRYREKLDDKAREFIEYAVEGCKRMQAQINDLLAFSRVGTQGKQLLPVSCDAALDRVLKGLKIAIEESKAVITRDRLPLVLADEGQLCQMFQNLIGNAMKFKGANPPRIHISAEVDRAGWRISVRDNGIGIAPEHQDRIFVIFQRLHTKAEYPGTGIGLAICKKIAERHHGRIWFEAAPGGGTTFYFTMLDGESNVKDARGHNELRLAATTN